MIMIGGETRLYSQESQTDTWELVGSHWVKLLPDFTSTPVNFIAVAYDTPRSTLVAHTDQGTLELQHLPSLPTLIAIDPLTGNIRRAASTRFNITASPDTEIARITLFRDSNVNGVWDPSDVSVGSARRGRDGQWSASVNSRSWPSGDVRIHAVAFEQFTDSPFSISTDVRVLNSVPVIANAFHPRVGSPHPARHSPCPPYARLIRTASSPASSTFSIRIAPAISIPATLLSVPPRLPA